MSSPEIGKNNDKGSENHNQPDVQDQRALSQQVNDSMRVQQTSDRTTTAQAGDATGQTERLQTLAFEQRPKVQNLPEGDQYTPGGTIGSKAEVHDAISWHIENTPKQYQPALVQYQKTLLS